MKFLLYLAIIVGGIPFFTPVVFGKTLDRSWARSTLQTEYMKFRHLNRMKPLLTEKLVIQGNAVDGISAYDRTSGQRQWARFFKNGVEGGAAIANGKLYFGANNGFFYSLDANTGKTLWKVPLGSETLTAPVVQGNFVFHLTGNNTLNAFDSATGKSLWVKTRPVKAIMTVRGQTQPLFHDGRIYVGFSDGVFAAYKAENGFEVWNRRIGDDKKFNDVDASARIYKNCVLVASYANSLYCLNKDSGAITWRHDQGGFLPVTVVDDRIFYPTGNREIHILDGPSGKLVKKILLKKGLATEVVAYQDTILYGETKGALVMRNKDSLEVLDSFSTGRGVFAPPSVDPERGEIYIHSNEANLFKLKVSSRGDKGFPWAKQ